MTTAQYKAGSANNRVSLHDQLLDQAGTPSQPCRFKWLTELKDSVLFRNSEMNADNSQPDGIEYGPDGDEIMTSEDNQNPITGTIDNSANGGANTDDTSSQPSGLQTSENSEPPFPRRPLTIPIGQASRFRFGSVDPSMLSDSDAQDSEPQHQQLLITQLRAEINALKGQLDGSLTAAQRSAVEHRDTLLRNAVSDKQELQKQLDTHKETYKTLQDILAQATRVDAVFSLHPPRDGPGGQAVRRDNDNNKRSRSPDGRRNQPNRGQQRDKRPKTSNRGEKGASTHGLNGIKQSAIDGRKSAGQCLRCAETGHSWKACPNPKKGPFAPVGGSGGQPQRTQSA